MTKSTNQDGKFWTPEEDDILMNSGKSLKQISEELDKTLYSAKNRKYCISCCRNIMLSQKC